MTLPKPKDNKQTKQRNFPHLSFFSVFFVYFILSYNGPYQHVQQDVLISICKLISTNCPKRNIGTTLFEARKMNFLCTNSIHVHPTPCFFPTKHGMTRGDLHGSLTAISADGPLCTDHRRKPPSAEGLGGHHQWRRGRGGTPCRLGLVGGGLLFMASQKKGMEAKTNL